MSAYVFPSAGFLSTYVEGGVSLGSSKTLKTDSRTREDIPAILHRGTLDYETSIPRKLANIKRTIFEFLAPEGDVASVKMTVSENARLRAGPVEFTTKTITTQIAASDSNVSISLISNHGLLGELRAERTSQGVSLAWRDGPLEADGALLKEVSRDIAYKRFGASSVASRKEFLPTRAMYVIERDDKGLDVLYLPPGGGRGGTSELPTGSGNASGADFYDQPRLFSFDDQDSRSTPPGDLYLRAAASPRWKLHSLLEEGTSSLNIEAVRLTTAVAIEHLNKMRWQRLQPLARGNRESPGVVERVFTNSGPSDKARVVQIQTHDPESGKIGGYIANNMLFLERPKDAKLQDPFNDLVIKEGLTSEYIARVISSAVTEPSGEIYKAAPARGPGEASGIRAASYSIEGRYDDAARELRDAAKSGYLKQAIAKYQEHVQREFLFHLRQSSAFGATQLFPSGELVDQNPDLEVVFSVLSLSKQNSNDAAKSLRAAFEHDRPQKRIVESAAEVFENLGSEAANDYMYARMGLIVGLLAGTAEHIALEAKGLRLHTVMDIAAFRGSRQLIDDQNILKSNKAIHDSPPRYIYIQDSRFLSRFDWDAEGIPAVIWLLRSSDATLEELETENLGRFRPTIIRAGTKQFIRRDLTSMVLREGEKILILHSCDLDDDGNITDRERAECKQGFP
jgi:hypothetical protein